MKYHVGTEQIAFYDVEQYIETLGGGQLIPLNQLQVLIETLSLVGTFWTGTKISCSRQAVIISNGSIKALPYDKTFKALVIFLEKESP